MPRSRPPRPECITLKVYGLGVKHNDTPGVFGSRSVNKVSQESNCSQHNDHFTLFVHCTLIIGSLQKVVD
ncbi:hypothetical protein J6590_103002, partial [Homalodisca vitripennis]